MKTATDILRENRIDTKSAASGRYYTTCPQCSAKRKPINQKQKCLGVTIGNEGVNFGCNHCQWTGGQKYDSVGNRDRRIVQSVPTARAEEVVPDRSARPIALWKSALDPRRTIAEKYLNGRGLSLGADIALSLVRFLPSYPWRDDQDRVVDHAVMLVAFRSIIDDRLVAVHRTALMPDGTKIGRKMLGPVKGAAMKIAPDTDVELGLTICEGFETGLAGRAMGFRPCWALGSAGAIATFPVLAGIDVLTMLAEPDAANASAVEQCGNRWADAGREVDVVMSTVGGDINDAYKATAS